MTRFIKLFILMLVASLLATSCSKNGGSGSSSADGHNHQTVACPDCGGTGYSGTRTCFSCGGKGTKVCSSCKGNGRCAKCGGSGVSGTGTCYLCQGKGTCRYCNGKGGSGTCTSCGGAGEFPVKCTTCNGTGVVTQESGGGSSGSTDLYTFISNITTAVIRVYSSGSAEITAENVDLYLRDGGDYYLKLGSTYCKVQRNSQSSFYGYNVSGFGYTASWSVTTGSTNYYYFNL